MSRLNEIKEHHNRELLATKNEQKKKEEMKQILVSQISLLFPRVAELIETGNACLQNDIVLDKYYKFGHSYDTYEKGTFIANGITHRLGFIQKYNSSNKPIIIGIGMIAGGACGDTNFLVTEDTITGVSDQKGFFCAPEIKHMEHFLEVFDKFETAFYAYVDSVVGKKPRTVKFAYKVISKKPIAVYNNPVYELAILKMIDDEVVSSGKIEWNKVGSEVVPSFSFDNNGLDIMYSGEFINVIRKYNLTSRTSRNVNFTFETCIKILEQYGFVDVTEGGKA